MDNVTIQLHELKALTTRFIELRENLNFARRELDDIISFLHGKIKLEDLDVD